MPIPRKFRRVALESEKNGFFRDLGRHFATYSARGKTCIVSFDNMKSRDANPPRYPWGYQFCAKNNYSQLGIMMTRRNDWFRQKPLADFFDELKETGFFEQFDNVVFYGSSMGGYAALTYAACFPQARAVAFTPQTSLSHEHVPWETRFRRGYERGDWSFDRYADAAETVPKISRAQVFYDPYYKLDNMHAKRLNYDNVDHFHCSFTEHKAPRLLLQMGILNEVTKKAIEGNLDAKTFNALYRKRRDCIAYFRMLTMKSFECKSSLSEAALRWADNKKPNWHIPRLKKLSAAVS
jgi:hypothetical protein